MLRRTSRADQSGGGVRRLIRWAIGQLICGAFVLSLFVAQTAHAIDLLEVYRRALENDPTLAMAAFSWQAQNENVTQAKAMFYPSVALSASLIQNSLDAVYTPYNWVTGSYDEIKLNTRNRSFAYGLTVIQPLFHYDRIQALKMVRANTRKAELERAHAQQSLILRVAESYFAILRAQENLQIAEAEVDALGAQMKEISNLYQSGLISPTDLAEGQAALDKAKVNRMMFEKDRQALLEGSFMLTGEPIEQIDGLGTASLPAVEEPLTDWEAHALAENLQLKAADLLIESLRHEISRSQAEYYPKVDLGLTYYKNNVESRSIAILDNDQDHTNRSASVTVTLPLEVSGATRSRIQQATFRMREAQQLLERQKRAVLAEVRHQYRQAYTDALRVQARETSIQSSEKAYQATRKEYLVGSRTMPEVLNAQRAQFIEKGDLMQARLDIILAQLRLKYAAGLLVAEDLQRWNSYLAP